MVVTQHCECTKCAELFSLNDYFLLWNFTSIKKGSCFCGAYKKCLSSFGDFFSPHIGFQRNCAFVKKGTCWPVMDDLAENKRISHFLSQTQ